MKTSNKKQSINIDSKELSAAAAEALNEAEIKFEGENKIASNDLAKPSNNVRIMRLLTYLTIPLFALAFAAYAYFGRCDSALKLIAPALTALFAAAVVLRLIPRLVLNRDLSDLRPVGERSAKKLHPVFRVVLLSLLLQAIVIICVYIAYSFKYGVDSTIIEGYRKLFVHSRGVLFGENTRSAVLQYGLLSYVLPDNIIRMTGDTSIYIPALALNFASILAASVFIYELVVCDYSKRCALFSAVLFNILPSAFILLQPFSGTAEFFAFTLLSLLLARRKKLLEAGFAALIASLFNAFSVLLVVPIAVEFFIHRRAAALDNKKAGKNPTPSCTSFVIGSILTLLPIVIAVALDALGKAGMYGFNKSGMYSFNALGGLVSSWNGGAIPNSIIWISVSALVLLALLIFFGAGKTRSSHTAFALVFTAVPAALSLDLILYGVFMLPILASLIGEKCTVKPARFAVAAAACLILALLTFFLYIVRPA